MFASRVFVNGLIGMVSVATCGAAIAQPTMTVIALPDLSEVSDVSADGATIVGAAYNPAVKRTQAFVWSSDGGFELIGSAFGEFSSEASAVSADGLVVAGSHSTDSAQLAFRWTKRNGFTTLPLIAGGKNASAMDISEDGSTIVGWTQDQFLYLGFRWSQASGVKVLPGPKDYCNAMAFSVSADGRFVGGTAENQWSDNRACVWDGVALEELPVVPPSFGIAHGRAMTTDGVFLAGETSSPQTKEETTFRYGPDGLINVGQMGMYNMRTITAISDDGGAILGRGLVAGKWTDGMLWTEGMGLLDLRNYLESLGLDLTPLLEVNAKALTPDGTVIAGTCSDVINGKRALLITGLPPLGELCYADLDASGVADVDDFVHFQNLYAIGNLTADCDKSGILDINDFVCFQTRFAVGCP